MKFPALAVFPVCLSASVTFAQDLSKGSWVDLTHAFNENSVYWPTAEMFTKIEVFAGHTDGGL